MLEADDDMPDKSWKEFPASAELGCRGGILQAVLGLTMAPAACRGFLNSLAITDQLSLSVQYDSLLPYDREGSLRERNGT